MVHSPHHSPFEKQRSPICSDGRSAGKSRVMIKSCGRISLLSLQLHLNAAREQTLVSDVIIAGWGVVVSLSRLKWKIAPHIFGRRVCCVTCLQKPPLQASLSTSFGVWKASWHRDSCFQLKPFGLIPSPVQVRCGAGGAEYRERFLCFIPQPNICPQR